MSKYILLYQIIKVNCININNQNNIITNHSDIVEEDNSTFSNKDKKKNLLSLNSNDKK